MKVVQVLFSSFLFSLLMLPSWVFHATSSLRAKSKMPLYYDTKVIQRLLLRQLPQANLLTLI